MPTTSMPKSTAIALVREGYSQFSVEGANRVLRQFREEPETVLLSGRIYSMGTECG